MTTNIPRSYNPRGGEGPASPQAPKEGEGSEPFNPEYPTECARMPRGARYWRIRGRDGYKLVEALEGTFHGVSRVAREGLWGKDTNDLSFAEALTLVDMLRRENAGLRNDVRSAETAYDEMTATAESMRERLARIDASAEVLIVAREDLMVAVDRTVAELQERGLAIKKDAGPTRASELCARSAALLDRLAAYMKGQDDRLVAMGEQVEMANFERLKERERAENAEAHVEKAERQARHDRERAGKLDARVRVLTGERDDLQGRLNGVTRDFRMVQENTATYREDARREVEAACTRAVAAEKASNRSRMILASVLEEMQRPPANVDAIRQRDPSTWDGGEAAEVALWAVKLQGNALRFAAELATMTDIEADFLDGVEVRTIASLLQVPDDGGWRAATLPRIYGEEDRGRAIGALNAFVERYRDDAKGEMVDAVAEALGMRRAGA